jgi:hypothetical protein
MWWHAIERADAPVAERAAHLLDFVSTGVERFANHEEDAIRTETSGLGNDSLAGWHAEYDLVHLSQDYATRRQHELLPTCHSVSEASGVRATAHFYSDGVAVCTAKSLAMFLAPHPLVKG